MDWYVIDPQKGAYYSTLIFEEHVGVFYFNFFWYNNHLVFRIYCLTNLDSRHINYSFKKSF